MVSVTRDNPPPRDKQFFTERLIPFIWSCELVVTAVPSSTLVSLETARQVTYSTKWRALETI